MDWMPAMPKLLSDALVINWMLILERRKIFMNSLALYLFPLAMLFFTRYLLPAGVVPGSRLVAGSMVFALASGALSGLVGCVSWWRFGRKQDLFVTAPVRKASYAGGLVFFFCLQAMISAMPIVLAAPFMGIDIQISPYLPVVVALTSTSLAGMALLIGTWAPNWETANTVNNVCGFLLLFVSPVYFPIARLPGWLQWPAHLSPYGYAANALTATLSGTGGFADDIAILGAISVLGLLLGVLGMRWRES